MGLIDDKDERMEQVPDRFISRSKAAQDTIYNRLIALITDFQTESGNITLTIENLAKIESIGNEILNVLFDSEYGEGLVEYLQEYDVQAELNAKIFMEEFGSFVDKDIFAQNLQTSKRLALDLMGREGLDANFNTPLKQILNDAIANGKSVKELVFDLELFIKGDENQLGALNSYISGIARDVFNIADRQYTRMVTEDIGAEWLYFTPGKVKDSREFCIKRNGKYYHKNEVIEWGHKPSTWQGRNKNTNDTTIFSYLGGYNCMHSVIPVSKSRVPSTVIRRNKIKGNVT